MPRYAMYVEDPLVARNAFRWRAPDTAPLPSFAQARPLLPAVHWEGHPVAAECWDKAWSLAFANLRAPAPGSGFVARFIDTAFNDSLFLWDTSFIVQFARYGRRAFDFQATLDNFYARQHPDGFICREIRESDGEDAFDRFDPSATGPNLLAWAEWSHYLHTADRGRLEAVLPPLLAYHRWFRKWRTWPDGSYWATGWACGMDNQPRMPPGNVAEHDHGHMGWLDTSLQQCLSARLLLSMNETLGGPWPMEDMRGEAAALTAYVNERMWSEGDGFYYDLWPGGRLGGVKSVGAFWALLAGVVPSGRAAKFIAHLENPAEFNRPHRVPSLSADHPLYRPGGDYWRGSVWAPATYMVLEGLAAAGRGDLAHVIALNHVTNVHVVFQRTGTLWENYAPESVSCGEQSAPDFVGWTGLPPIAVLLEHVFGLKHDAPGGRVSWDVRLTDAHGVDRCPVGQGGELSVQCARRRTARERPAIEASCSVPLALELRWEGGSETLRLEPGRPASSGGQR